MRELERLQQRLVHRGAPPEFRLASEQVTRDVKAAHPRDERLSLVVDAPRNVHASHLHPVPDLIAHRARNDEVRCGDSSRALQEQCVVRYRVSETPGVGAQRATENSFRHGRYAVSGNDVRCNPPAAVDGATAIGPEFLAWHSRGIFRFIIAWNPPRYRTPRGREPAGSRDFEAALRPERDYTLRASLSVGRCTDNHRAIVILQRTSNDLGRTRTSSIDEHEKRELRPPLLGSVRIFAVRVRHPSTHAHDLLSPIEEEIRHPHTLSQQSARIGSYVENKRLHSPSKKPSYRAVQLLPGGIAERLEIDVADAVTQHRRPADSALVNRRTLNLEIDRCGNSRTLDLERNEGAGFPAQHLRCFLVRPTPCGLSGYLDDPVPRLKS